jgi:CHAT domain-containing protein/Tfp pilus assembly protein PilF
VALAGASPAPTDPPALVDGLTLEREIRGGDSHEYPVSLDEGGFLQVVVEQRKIDLVVRLLDPEGQEIVLVDGPESWRWDEELASVARSSGVHRIEIRGSGKPDTIGSYRLQVEGPRRVRDGDPLREDAVRANQNATNKMMERTAESLRRQVQYREKAADLWKQLGERVREAETLYLLGGVQSRLDQPDAAAASFLRAAELWTEARYQVYRSDAWNRAALALKEGRHYEEAAKHFQSALNLAREIEDPSLQARILSNLGNLFTDRGEPAQGIKPLTEALQISRDIGDRSRKVSVLNNLGFAHMELSEPQKAIECYLEALHDASDLGDRAMEAVTLNNLGDAYATLGDFDKALAHFNQALAINRELKDRPKEATDLNNLGFAHLGLGEPQKALESFDQAIALARELKERSLESVALVNRSILHLQELRPREAREDAEKALTLAQGTQGGTIEIDARLMLGAALRKLGDLPGARRELERGLAISRERKTLDREAAITLTLARLDRDGGQLLDALDRTRTAIEIVESLRTRVVSQDLRASFFASKQDYYEFQIDTLMALHQSRPEAGFATDALQVSESARARGLLEILTAAGADIAERERYASLTRPRLLNVREIQSQVLDGEAVLLEYALGKERSYLWVVTPDAIRGFELPGRQIVEEAARRYYTALTARNAKVSGESVPDYRKRIQQADADAVGAAAELSRLVLGQAEPLLGARPILVVADGALQYIPFSALPIPSTGEPLASRNAVVNLPSASALAVLRLELAGRPPAPKTVAVFADPVFQSTDERLVPGRPSLGAETLTPATRDGAVDLSRLRRLPASSREAHAILGLVPADQGFRALGFEASRATVTSGKLASYRKVHFATHGLLDSRRPELSGLVLSLFDAKGQPQEGLLRLHDIYNLQLNADLVVLSACQTALGKEVRGEGLVGLTRGFMYAGAARVLASLWSVEDRATAKLMASFYRGMLQENLSPAAALRRAQLELSRDPNWESPYYWAGFSLQGEWR